MTWLLAAALLLSAVLAWRLWLERREKQRLFKELQALLANPDEAYDINLREGSFALLENTLKELVSRLRLERLLRRQDARDTADSLMHLSHQLKTPLSALKMHEELAPGPYSDRQQLLIGRMEHLLNMVLRLEKLRAGGYVMTFDLCDLAQPLNAARGRLQSLFPQVGLSAKGAAQARADRDWLEEAFLNLLKNACEHMPDGGHITVRFEQTEDAVHISLQDTGGGVANEDLPRLFDRFYTSASRQGGGGAGIGLSMVREIIRAHHGDITVQNAADGLRFDITLPRIERNLTRT